jgi:glycosyltransferase involved in cell wall biosynthesis
MSRAGVVAAPDPAGDPDTPFSARPVRSFLFLGSMIPAKGPDIALAAFGAVADPRLRLTLAGPSVPWRGSMAWSLALEARARTTSGVQWRGGVAPAEVPSLLDAHDALVFPSIWIENSPLVLREARARGLLVLASDVPGAREVAPEASFVPPGRTGAWAAALRAAAASPPRVRTPLLDAPSLAGHASALLTRYESLLRAPAPVPPHP